VIVGKFLAEKDFKKKKEMRGLKKKQNTGIQMGELSPTKRNGPVGFKICGGEGVWEQVSPGYAQHQ